MRCAAVLIDARPDYMAAATTPWSLLTLPLCGGTVLDSLRGELGELCHDEMYVLPRFEASPDYRDVIRGRSSANEPVIRDLGQLLAGSEPTDWFLLLDAGQTLHAPMPAEALRARTDDPRWATNYIVECDRSAVHERVCVDDSGQISRIQRYYEGVTATAGGELVAILVSAAALRQVEVAGLHDLASLREAMMKRGVPQRDEFTGTAGPGPSSPAGLLQYLRGQLQDPPDTDHFAARRIQIGRGVTIDETARLHGTVYVQDGAHIDREALIVGPALIGADARIGPGAVVAQGLVGPGAVVPPEARLHRRVFLAGMESIEEWPLAIAPMGDSFDSDTSWPGQTGGHSRAYLRVKRAIESTLAIAGLVILSPLLLITAAVIKATSRGPVLYGDQREGKDGQAFRCWKFRTMVADAAARQRTLSSGNTVDGPQFKLENDTRVTGVGRWLRATNLDELPQLINVACGEMSLIGPRPSPFRENQICVPWRQARLAVRPGITGMWQMCRRDRAMGDFHQWIHYDLLYVRNVSPWLDLKIMIATLLTLGGRWPVPPHWLVSRRALQQQERSRVMLPRRAPWLERQELEGRQAAVPRSPREAVGGDDRGRQAFLQGLHDLTLRALPTMFMPQRRLFVHSMRRRGSDVVPSGRSARYTAIVLLGLADCTESVAARVLHGIAPADVLDALILSAPQIASLGDVAMIYWAACRWGHPKRAVVGKQLESLLSRQRTVKTVDLSWSLAACCAEQDSTARNGALRYRLADLLMSTFNNASNAFPWRTGAASGLRDHVASFADQVYPIQALSNYHRAVHSPAALEIAARTADHICEQMGGDGQWWWHYDARTGETLERYPVYSVHQDAMAPMALHALADAGGPYHRSEIELGLDWLRSAPEIGGHSLVDHDAGVIWRKVGRRETGKLARSVQSLASRARVGLRVPGLDRAMPPGRIDFECRPYHLGWFLEAWSTQLGGNSRTEVRTA